MFFEAGIFIDVNIPLNPIIENFETNYEYFGSDICINESNVYKTTLIDIGTIETFSSIFFTATNSTFYVNRGFETSFYTNNIRSFDFFNNQFIYGNRLSILCLPYSHNKTPGLKRKHHHIFMMASIDSLGTN